LQTSARSFLVLFVAYALVVGALGYFSFAALRESTHLQMGEAAKRVEAVVTTSIGQTTIERIIEGSAVERAQLLGHLRAIAEESPLIESTVVVDRNGHVIELAGPSDRKVETPREIFARDVRPQLHRIPAAALSPGDYVLDVPLIDDGAPVAYLRLQLDASRIEPIYARARRRTFVVAIIGLIAIGALALMIHLQIRGQSQQIAGALTLALAGSAVETKQSEFSEVFRAVNELTGEVSRLRGQTRVRRRMSEMAEMNDIAIAIVEPDLRLDYATRPARELFQLGPEGEGWDFVQSLLTDEVDRDAAGRTIEIDLPGRAVLCQVHAIPHDRRLMLLFRDLSLLRSLETDLRIAAYARGLTRLYMGVAHDFKAPLNALILNLELLRDSLDDQRTDPEQLLDEQRRWVRVIGEEIGRLRKMIQSLLSLSAPPREEREAFDLREVIRDAEFLLAPQARQQNVSLATELGDEPLPIVGHRDRIKQSVLNVAINALEVMPDGGRLSIASRRARDTATVTIADSGPGIPDEVRARIFNLHFTTKATGTGIGLYVARSVLAAEGGSLELISTGSGGTTFEVGLPIREESALESR